MTLQLGTLRDALLEAGATPDKANEASEEVAGYGNRLTRLTAMTQATTALLVVLTGCQAAIWIKMGEISGQLAALSARIH